MIAHIRGTIVRKSPTRVVIETAGVGYELLVSVNCADQLPEKGREVQLDTYLHVREDIMQLYGFLDETEKEMFLLLISISGIGPKLALTILSGRGASELRNLVARGDVAALTTIPGIGRKTAERIVVELRDKFSSLSEMGDTGGLSTPQTEAVKALLALGYSRQVAEKALKKAISEFRADADSVQNLIKTALKVLSGR